MGTVEGYLVVSKKNGRKHYFMPTVRKWTPDLMRVSLKDINESKIEVDMEKYPDMDLEYTHEKITIDGNFYD
jgi:hypothetical protein